MPEPWNEYLNALFRWLHIIAGVMWIGHLWFFNFVNSQVAKTYDAESKKKVVPELMPRALYWFRWGAAYTWITGFLLLALVYYMGGIMVEQPLPEGALNNWAASGIGVGALVVGWLVYDNLWKALAKNQPLGVGISWVLITGAAFALNEFVMEGRAMFIHIGAIFGTAMFLNVWVRIWPAQKKIIAAIKEGNAPPEGLGPLAGLRSKHNTYMAVPLLLLMVSNHFPTITGELMNWTWAAVIIALGWAGTWLMYKKAAQPATAKY